MILIDDHAAAIPDTLAAAHYIFLNPRNNPQKGQVLGDFNAYSLIGRIKSKRKLSVAAGIQPQIDFWDYLLNNNEEKLEAIIMSRPPRLKVLIAEIDNLFTNALFSVNNSYTDAALTAFGTMVADAFAYKTLYRKKEECVENFRKLSLRHCPYCNLTTTECITYTERLSTLQKQKALHQLDHFYPQSRHPYLALSFFNLVPGCTYCNGQLKLEMDFDVDTHFNPYHRRLDDHFTFAVNTITPAKKEDLVFSYTSKNASVYSDQALNDFRIMERYNQNHQLPAFELINHLRFYGPDVTLSAMQQVPDVFETELEAHDSLLQMGGVPRQPREINNYSLGKLKRDICIQMDML